MNNTRQEIKKTKRKLRRLRRKYRHQIIKAILLKFIGNNYNLKRKYDQALLNRRKRIYMKKYYNLPINDKMIVFDAFMGRKYVDSPKAIYEYMLRNPKFSDYTFVWAFKSPNKKKYYFNNNRTIVIKYNSATYFEYCAQAKYWITNSRIPEYLIKKDEQVFIQCWHGTPLKKLGFDIEVKGGNENTDNELLRQKYNNDAMRYDYMISPSKYCSEKFISAFNLKDLGKEDIIIEEGYPRNDYLINYKESDIEEIKINLNIPRDKKVILYAPTWRDNQHTIGVGYTYELGVDFDNLRKSLSDEYIILFRAHYFVANQFDFEKYNGFVYNVSDYEDINDLYVISDMLITDYSSVFFDYANLKRPILFYMYDLEEYKNNLRDFYIDLDELPGPIIEEENELIKTIKKNKFIYDKKYKKFNAKFNYLDDGNATKRVIEKIFKNNF